MSELEAFKEEVSKQLHKLKIKHWGQHTLNDRYVFIEVVENNDNVKWHYFRIDDGTRAENPK